VGEKGSAKARKGGEKKNEAGRRFKPATSEGEPRKGPGNELLSQGKRMHRSNEPHSGVQRKWGEGGRGDGAHRVLGEGDHEI